MTQYMSDDELRQAYHALLRQQPQPDDRPAVDFERMLEVVEGRGNEARRLATIDAIMADAESTREFELLRALAANVPRRPPAWRRPLLMVPLAAAAALLLVALPTLRQQSGNTTPEPVRDAAQAPVLLAPPTDASPAQASTFRWSAVPGARLYALEILTAAGRPVFTTRTADTTVTLPADVVIAQAVEHRWWVVSELGDGTQRRSAFRRLVVRQTR